MLNNLLELSFLDPVLSRLGQKSRLRLIFVQTTFGYMINVLWVKKVVSLWSLCSKQDTYGPAHSCGNCPLEFLFFPLITEADQGDEADVSSELGRIQVL